MAIYYAIAPNSSESLIMVHALRVWLTYIYSYIVYVCLTSPLANTGLLEADITPSNTSVPEQTSSSLICTATLPDSFTVSKTFHWLRTAPGGTAAPAPNQSITVANANSPTSMSILTVRESVLGTYMYTCIVRVNVPGDPSLMASANASVSVTGEQTVFVAMWMHTSASSDSE